MCLGMETLNTLKRPNAALRLFGFRVQYKERLATMEWKHKSYVSRVRVSVCVRASVRVNACRNLDKTHAHTRTSMIIMQGLCVYWIVESRSTYARACVFREKRSFVVVVVGVVVRAPRGHDGRHMFVQIAALYATGHLY